MMTANGLAKLVEECGELIVVAGEWLTTQSPATDRFEEEIGDVLAALGLVAETFNLTDRIFPTPNLQRSVTPQVAVTELVTALGGLTQIIGKKLAYYHTDVHPDGELLQERIETRIRSVIAAISVTASMLGLETETGSVVACGNVRK